MAVEPLEFSKTVKDIARRVGFDLCGVANAGPTPHSSFLSEWLARGYAGDMHYLHRHVDSRRDLRNWLPWAKSVIAVALNYYSAEPQVPAPSEPRGRVARYAWGHDYHEVMREKLEIMVGAIREETGKSFEARVCVDTSAILERELAAAAGLGWIGKNTMLLHPSRGSYLFLGVIVIGVELTPDEPLPEQCGNCTRCLKACPTRAFPDAHVIDASRCISYLTIEHRGEIDSALAARMGDWVFGCDVCQEVCPYNRCSASTKEPAFQGSLEASRPLLADILAWNESKYRVATHDRATRRAKLAMWKRNAEIAAKIAT